MELFLSSANLEAEPKSIRRTTSFREDTVLTIALLSHSELSWLEAVE
jgi:hypothetical protein